MFTIVSLPKPRRSVPSRSLRTGSHRHHSASVSVLQASLIAIHFPISTLHFPTSYQIGTPSSQEAPSLMDNVLQHLRTWVSSTSSSFQFIHATDNSLVDKSRIGHWHWQWADLSCFFSAFYYHWRSFSNRLQDTTSPSTGRRARSYSHIAT